MITQYQSKESLIVSYSNMPYNFIDRVAQWMEVFLGILPFTLSFNAAFPYVNLLSLFSFILVKKIRYPFAFHFHVRVDRSAFTNITSAICTGDV